MLEAEDVVMNVIVIDVPLRAWKQTRELDKFSLGTGPRITSTV